MFELYGRKPRTALDIMNKGLRIEKKIGMRMKAARTQALHLARPHNPQPDTIDDGSRNLSIPTKDCMGLNELCLTTVSNESPDNCNKNNQMVGHVNGTGVLKSYS